MNLPGNTSQDVNKIKAEIDKMHEQVMQKDFLQILGVTIESPPDVVTNAYRQLAKKWHRDVYASLPLGRAGDKLDEIFSKISEAHETLTTPAKRSEYMVFLKRKSQGLATDVNSILKAEELFDNALGALKRKQYKEARSLLEDAIKLNKDEPLFHASLGWAMFKLDPKLNFKAAVDALKRSIELRENTPEAYVYLGEVYVATGDTDEALRWFKRCLKFDSKNIEASRQVRLLNQRIEQKKKSESGLMGFINKILKK